MSDDFEAAHALLLAGHYSDGWTAYERRGPRVTSPAMNCGLPEWTGQPVAGKRFLVVGEQGLGDEIQFSRFVPLLRERGAAHITLAVNPLLTGLLAQVGADLVVDRLQRNILPPADVWVCLGSLPHRLGLTQERDFRASPYLKAPEPQGRGIGLVWRGNPAHPRNVERSLASPNELLEAFPSGHILEPRGDMLDSANQLAGLDALVTVDTSWAHLAGALGVPCALLLTSSYSDWRWRDGRGKSCWYDSVTLFRQDQPGDWNGPIHRARASLAQPRENQQQTARRAG